MTRSDGQTASLLADHLSSWALPRRATHRGSRCPFRLSSAALGGPAHDAELASLVVDAGLREFWSVARSADLCRDHEYGQWGLHILSPADTGKLTAWQLESRPLDFRLTDLVVGKFYGDSDLLVMDRARPMDHGYGLMVAMPLDRKGDWPDVAGSFAEFLERYLDDEGDKYWEA